MSSNGGQYGVEPIGIEYFDHVTKRNQSDRSIFTFHSLAILKTAEAPEH